MWWVEFEFNQFQKKVFDSVAQSEYHNIVLVKN